MSRTAITAPGAGRTRSSPSIRDELDDLVADYERYPTSQRQVRIKALRDRINRIDRRVARRIAGIADRF
jgi:hypothetical protein